MKTIWIWYRTMGMASGSQKADEIVGKFTKAGEFEYSCLIPGHREAGMVGTIVVK